MTEGHLFPSFRRRFGNLWRAHDLLWVAIASRLFSRLRDAKHRRVLTDKDRIRISNKRNLLDKGSNDVVSLEQFHVQPGPCRTATDHIRLYGLPPICNKRHHFCRREAQQSRDSYWIAAGHEKN